MRRPLLALVSALGLVACEPVPTFPLPMTATDLVRHGSGHALVAYLSQPDASPSVCDPEARSPHLLALDPRGARLLVEAFDAGHIPPELFRRCADRLLHTPVARPLLDAMGIAYRRLVKSSEIESDPRLERRVEALHALYVERPQGTNPDPELLTEWNRELERAVIEGRLGATAARHATELLETFSLERGRWNGAAVTENTLDVVQNRRDEALLRRFAARLPDPDLRRQALRRIVRLHIAATTYPEVRSRAKVVEDLMMKQGRNPLPLDQFPPVSGAVDSPRLLIDRVLVRQDVAAGTAKILGARGSVVPEASLRGPLQVQVTGVARPITLCGPTRDLDPTPCLDSSSLRVGNPLVSVDRDGGLVFVDAARLGDLLPLARAADFLVPLAAGGLELATVRLGIWFEKPGDMPFSGGQPLLVDIDARGERRLVYTIAGQGFSYTAVVERPDVRAFRITSQGVPGVPGRDGQPGFDGAAGRPGTNAMCPSLPGGPGQRGFDGGIGGPGSPGGPGGRGGDITVRLACGARDCGPLAAELRGAILSMGGPGGLGGHGGPGGKGGVAGPGGAGADCTIPNVNGVPTVSSLPPGASATNGLDGLRGPEGAPGPAGPPGMVTVQVLP